MCVERVCALCVCERERAREPSSNIKKAEVRYIYMTPRVTVDTFHEYSKRLGISEGGMIRLY